MAKKKEYIDETQAEIKKLVEEKKAIIGTERTLKALQNDKVNKIFLSSNCPESAKGDIESFATDVEVVELKIPNTELGTLCKKPFVISVLSAVKDGQD